MENPNIDGAEFRKILGNYPTGVTLVSAKDEKGPFAMVIGSFGSVSLDPALVQFMPAKGSKTWERIAATGNYCVNVLNEKQLPLSNSFFDKEKDPFNAIEWREGTTGSPIIKDCVAWVDCVIGDIHDAGDHYIVIGEVQEIGCENQTDGPLLFLGGSYGSFTELTES
ncbi:MAG: flavin reductase family protein [Acidimicrobiales bacterium]|jgi:flavin reductase (DIM6/NTAB) family NADH-FMN oxidoreductase RutF|nr:flavin reductase family protein [Acidimicrobiales bacterium]MDP6298752.1 flavin reductase family protein [Acidimicrobiales bacterium]